MAALMTPALPEPVRVRGEPARGQKRASNEASEEEEVSEMDASGDADGADPVDQEGDEAATSSPGGRKSDDGGEDEGDDDGEDTEDDDDNYEVDEDDNKVGQEEEEDELGDDELGRFASEMLRHPLKRLRRGLHEEAPASGTIRELRRSAEEYSSLQIPVFVQVPARRRHAPATIP